MNTEINCRSFKKKGKETSQVTLENDGGALKYGRYNKHELKLENSKDCDDVESIKLSREREKVKGQTGSCDR